MIILSEPLEMNKSSAITIRELPINEVAATLCSDKCPNFLYNGFANAAGKKANPVMSATLKAELLLTPMISHPTNNKMAPTDVLNKNKLLRYKYFLFIIISLF